MKSLIAYFVERSIFVNLLTLLLVVVGGYSASTMRREAFPNVDFDVVIVTTIFPGASPDEVEKLVTNPIEESIKEVDGLKEVKSSSIENRSGVIVTIDPDVKSVSKVVDDIRSAVERTEDLPEDAEKPLIIEMTSSNQPIIEVNLGAKQKNGVPLITERELRAHARHLEDELLKIDSVARIDRRGWRDSEMQVNVNPRKLKSNYLSIDQLIYALRNRNINFPGGDLTEGQREIVVRTVGEFNTAREVGNVFVRSNDVGTGVQVKDIASVEEGFVDRDLIEKTRGYPSISLTVIKRESGDAIELVDEVKRVVDSYRKKAPPTIDFSYSNDISFFIRRRLGVLFSNGISGLLLVVASLFVFMGWRTSLMVAIGIPVALGTSFIVLNYLGVTLNLISMFGFIVVVGILVDDAIIVSENFYRHLEEGHSTLEAAIKGTQQIVSPVLATVTTTIAAFAPLMFMTGIMGKFIMYIPFVIIVALAASLFEAFFILPSHLHDANKYSNRLAELKDESHWFKEFRTHFYEPLLDYVLHRRRVVMALITGVFFFFLVLQKLFGSFVLFPDVIDTFQIKVTADTGYNLEYTDQFIKVIESEIKKLPKDELDTYVTRVGIIRKNVNDPFAKRGNNFAQIMVYLTPEQGRKRLAGEIVGEIRQKIEWMLKPEVRKAEQDEKEKSKGSALKRFADKLLSFFRKGADEKKARSYKIPAQWKHLEGKLVGLEFEKLQGGPPVGKPVSIEITGDEFSVLLKIADEYKKKLRTIAGVVDIDDDYDEGKEEVRIKIKEDLVSQTGTNVAQIAMAINAAFHGNVATTIRRAEEEVDVRVRFDESFRKSVSSLKNVYVMNSRGNLIPVARLVSQEKGRGVTAINHVDGKRLVTVTANVSGDLDSVQANALIAEKAANVIKKYPGYYVKFGGENKDTQESMESLGRAFLVGFVIIFMILASLFHSFIQPIVVVAAIPFAMIGVIFAFLLHGLPFSFMAMMGLVGLSGVVVNDSIVLVDFANNIRKENPQMSLHDVLLKAGSLRLRAVLLTTITTVLGLLPTAYGIGGHDPFLVPMALAFAWGLAFSTVLTLLIVPVQYYAVESMKLRIRKLFRLKEH